MVLCAGQTRSRARPTRARPAAKSRIAAPVGRNNLGTEDPQHRGVRRSRAQGSRWCGVARRPVSLLGWRYLSGAFGGNCGPLWSLAPALAPDCPRITTLAPEPSRTSVNKKPRISAGFLDSIGPSRIRIWRPGSESNRRTRICSPLHDHSATRPGDCALCPDRCTEASVVPAVPAFRGPEKTKPRRTEVLLKSGAGNET